MGSRKDALPGKNHKSFAKLHQYSVKDGNSITPGIPEIFTTPGFFWHRQCHHHTRIRFNSKRHKTHLNRDKFESNLNVRGIRVPHTASNYCTSGTDFSKFCEKLFPRYSHLPGIQKCSLRLQVGMEENFW